MSAEKKETCYQECCVKAFQFYLAHSGEHEAIRQGVHRVLPGEFKRIGAGKSSLDMLGVGSGGGEMDVEMLTLLQSTYPGVPITADIVEGSTELTSQFKALVAKTDNLKNVQIQWHTMPSEDYTKKVKEGEHKKKFDFIHMIQMIYYVDNLADTIQFYHGLLKENGRFMIINEIDGGGWDTLWKTHSKDLCTDTIMEYRSTKEIKACLDKMGLKYDEYEVPNFYDISECFNPESKLGHELLNFMTAKADFYASLGPEVRAAILDVLKNKCSTEKDGKIMFNSTLGCLLIHA